MLCLVATQIRCKLGRERCIELIQKMHHQDVFGRNRAVRFELELPVTRRGLPVDQRIARCVNGGVQLRRIGSSRYAVREQIRAGRRLRVGEWRAGRQGTTHVAEPPSERRRSRSSGADSTWMRLA